MIPVFAYTSVSLGGLGWDISWISYVFLVLAGIQVFIYLFAFPPFLRLLGVRRGLIAVGCFITFTFISAPLCNLAIRYQRVDLLYPLLSSTGIFAVLTNMYWGEEYAFKFSVPYANFVNSSIAHRHLRSSHQRCFTWSNCFRQN